jgi:hypothetical protein
LGGATAGDIANSECMVSPPALNRSVEAGGHSARASNVGVGVEAAVEGEGCAVCRERWADGGVEENEEEAREEESGESERRPSPLPLPDMKLNRCEGVGAEPFRGSGRGRGRGGTTAPPATAAAEAVLGAAAVDAEADGTAKELSVALGGSTKCTCGQSGVRQLLCKKYLHRLTPLLAAAVALALALAVAEAEAETDAEAEAVEGAGLCACAASG